MRRFLVGTVGVEPTRLAAHDPKSCSSANSDTSSLLCQAGKIIPQGMRICENKRLNMAIFGVSFMPDQSENKKTYMTRKQIFGLETWVTAFLRDGKSRGLPVFAVEFYCAQSTFDAREARERGSTVGRML
jgi:hypothetical protein